MERFLVQLCEVDDLRNSHKTIGFISGTYISEIGPLTCYLKPILVPHQNFSFIEIDVLPIQAYYASEDFYTVFVHLFNVQGKPLSGVMAMSRRQIAQMMADNVQSIDSRVYKLKGPINYQPLGCKAEVRAVARLRKK